MLVVSGLCEPAHHKRRAPHVDLIKMTISLLEKTASAARTYVCEGLCASVAHAPKNLEEMDMTDHTRRDTLALAAAAAGLALAPGFALAQAPAASAPAAAGPTQAPGFYRQRIGDIIVTAINDGAGARPNLDGMVRNVETAEVARVLSSQFVPAAPFLNPFTTLVVQTGGRLILLDTGLGDSGPPGTGTWMRNFRAAGFDPAQVNTILISHFHGDHIGGIRLRGGEYQFPNAEIVVPEPEWAFWMSDERMNALPEAQRGGFMNARRVFSSIAGNVRRFVPGGEMAPGITSVPTFGHSPGHTGFVIASGNARLLYVGDAITTPSLYMTNPDWSPFFDMDEAAGRATRRRVLDMAATERLQMHVYHAPFPAQGFVTRAGTGFQFVPTPWNSAV